MIRDRVVELRRVRAGDLLENPKNWRKHPEGQREALRGVLTEIGYADACLGRIDEVTGEVLLIDGHLRRSLDPEQVLPVLIVDLTEEEANKLLLTLDPLAAMAGQDDVKLEELLAEVKTESVGLKALLDSLEAGLPKSGPPAAKPEIEISPELLERQDYLVVSFDNELDWQVACDKLGIKAVRDAVIKPESTLVTRGTGRVIKASRLLEALK